MASSSSGGSSGSSSGGSSYRRDTSEDAKWNRAFAKVKSNNARSKAEDARLNSAFDQLKAQRGVATYNVAQPSTAKNTPQTETWQQALTRYTTDKTAGQDEIARAGQVYNQKIAAGDSAGANAAHVWANQIRDAMGLQGTYDPTSGRNLLTNNTTGTKQTLTAEDYAALGFPAYVPLDNSALYEQQGKEKAAAIRAAIQRSRTTAEGNISGLESQYGTAIQTAQNYGAQLPGQFTQYNNQASNRGYVNAQRIRTAMAQMGLGQSGASASQQLEQSLATDNQINSNNQELQNLTTDINTQVTGLQGEKASKVAAIRQAIADAEASGDEQAALALSEVQAKIASEASQNAVNANTWNLGLADRAQKIKELNDKNAWDRSGFDSAIALYEAKNRLDQASDIAKIQTDYETKLKLLQEEARLGKYRTSSSGGLTSNQQYQISSSKATSNALLQISSYGTKAAALAALKQHGSDMISQGVDIQAVLDAINDRWPY